MGYQRGARRLARTTPGSGGRSCRSCTRAALGGFSISVGVGRPELLPAEHAFDVEAIDGNPAGLAVVRETAAARGLSVSLHNGFADALPYPDTDFDYVLS